MTAHDDREAKLKRIAFLETLAMNSKPGRVIGYIISEMNRLTNEVLLK